MDTLAKSANTLTSSDDEDKQDCLPKIVNTISLQGCSEALSFDNNPEEQGEDGDLSDLLYPSCDLREENSSNATLDSKQDNSISGHSKQEKERKRVKLTTLNVLRPPKTSKPKLFTPRDDRHHVVDARKLALQESLFKTKELFGTFLRVCQDQDNTTEMERVVDKLSRAYDKTRQEFLGSMRFQNILEAETDKVNSANTKPWLNLKFVLDELKHNKIGNANKLKVGDSEESQNDDDEPFIECPKKRRHLKKLEKTLRQLNLKIKKLEEREVDFDDDNSSYVKLDRYRLQFTKVYTKVCEIKGKLADADRPYLRKVSFAGSSLGTTYPHINRCIERYYNKHREFPDFQDIKKLVMIANKQENIEMPPIKIHSMAQAAFKEFGEMLKRLRQYDDYDVIISYLDQPVDPARDNPELQEELNKNALLFKKKEQEVIDRFAAEDAGIHSLSGQESESKPKKKRKIIITAPRNKPLQTSVPLAANAKRHLSSSESSDEEKDTNVKKTSKPASSFSSDSEEEEKDVKVKKRLKPASLSDISISSDDDSDNESKIFKTRNSPQKPLNKSKGKALLGKQRIIKRGKKPKESTPKTSISSDEEESTPKNPKDTLTSYLGLQIKNEQKDDNIKKEIDEEITCIKEIPIENKTVKSSSDSETSLKSSTSLKSLNITDKGREDANSGDGSTKVNLIKNRNDDEDSNSSIDIVEEVVNPKVAVKPEESNSMLKKKTLNLSKSKNFSRNNNGNVCNSRRTSVSKSAKRKETSESDSEISTQDLTSDSDIEQKKENDSQTIVLSEEVMVETKTITNGSKPKKTSEDDSDSDICILSQEPKAKETVPILRKALERKNSSSEVNLLPTRNNRQLIAPRKVLPAKKPSSGSTSPSSAHQRRLGPMTSTPTRPLTKRRPSNQSNGLANKRPRTDKMKQSTLPRVLNGAANTSKPVDIPLIELD